MPELHLQRAGDNLTTLTISIGEYSASIPWADIAPDEPGGQCNFDDARAYGRDLFDKTFRDESLRTALDNLHTNERLVPVTGDPTVAAIPREYLREHDGRLLAARLSLLRSVPEAQHNEGLELQLHVTMTCFGP